MNITLEHEFDLEDTYAKLGELAENPPHFATSDAFADEDDAPVAFDGRLDCGALDLDLECQGARLA